MKKMLIFWAILSIHTFLQSSEGKLEKSLSSLSLKNSLIAFSTMQRKQITDKNLRGPICALPSSSSNCHLLAGIKRKKWVDYGDQMIPFLIDTQKGNLLDTSFEDTYRLIEYISTNKDGTQLIAGSQPFAHYPSIAFIYNIETGKIISQISEEVEKPKCVYDIILSPNEKEIWFVSSKGIIRYDIKNKLYIGAFDTCYNAISPDHTIGMVKEKNNLTVRNIVADTDLQSFDIPQDPLHPIAGISISPNNKYFVVLQDLSKEAFIGSLENGYYTKATLYNVAGNPSSAAFDSESSYIAFAINNENNEYIPILNTNGTLITELKTDMGAAVPGKGTGSWNKEYLALYLSGKNQSFIELFTQK